MGSLLRLRPVPGSIPARDPPASRGRHGPAPQPLQGRPRRGRQQIGLWVSLIDGFAAEAVAGAGFDWLLLDTEHSPGHELSVLAQLQALAPYPLSPIVRPKVNDTALIKRFLDIGAQTLLIPYVQSVAEAEAAVAAMRYPPRGVRGISTLTRATGYGRIPDYLARAEEELCLIVQIETRAGLDALEAIAAVDGVHGLFIGPSDLSASLGHLGDPGHPEVVAAIEDAIARIRAAGKPAGFLASTRRRPAARSRSAPPSPPSAPTSRSSPAAPTPSAPPTAPEPPASAPSLPVRAFARRRHAGPARNPKDFIRAEACQAVAEAPQRGERKTATALAQLPHLHPSPELMRSANR